MFRPTWDIFWSASSTVSLLVRHNSGRLNVLADGLSRRHQVIGTELSLHPDIVRQMFSVWCIPELDLFATPPIHKLTGSISVSSSRPFVKILGTSSGCMHIPPTAQMQHVLHKLVHSTQCRMLLVASLQHPQPWLPTLFRLLVDFPRELPPLPRLLGQPQSGVFHRHPNQVHRFG